MIEEVAAASVEAVAVIEVAGAASAVAVVVAEAVSAVVAVAIEVAEVVAVADEAAVPSVVALALALKSSWSPIPASLASTFSVARTMCCLQGTQRSARVSTTKRESQLR